MKIFFDASPRGKKDLNTIYESIFSITQLLGYRHITDEILTIDPSEFYSGILENSGSMENLYRKKINFIQKSDICLFECTTVGLGLGFVIVKSMELGKPTIVLYQGKSIPYFLIGIKDPLLHVVRYNKENLKKVLIKTLSEARTQREKRLNLYLTSKIYTHVYIKSKENKSSMSGYVRGLIVEDMIRKV